MKNAPLPEGVRETIECTQFGVSALQSHIGVDQVHALVAAAKEQNTSPRAVLREAVAAYLGVSR